MNEISVLGIDLAKRVFQFHGVDRFGNAILRKRISRSEIQRTVALIPKCVIAMEACAGAHHWGRTFQELGHEVRLIAPQFVKPYVKSNKNDAADAEAIAEAAQRPSMRFVAVKPIEHQNIQSLHRVRSRLIDGRVALTNEIHGLLHEYGIVMDEYREVLKRIDVLSKKITTISETNETCKRLKEIPGVGPVVATAVYAAGDPYIRKVLIHGARAVLYHAEGKSDRLHRWALKKHENRGYNRAVVGVANKTVRTMWAMMTRGEEYRPAA